MPKRLVEMGSVHLRYEGVPKITLGVVTSNNNEPVNNAGLAQLNRLQSAYCGWANVGFPFEREAKFSGVEILRQV